jgi:hypothetical protein
VKLKAGLTTASLATTLKKRQTMSDEKIKSVHKVRNIDAGKSVAWKDGQAGSLREGEKPSAPANLVLPKPVAMPAAPNNKTPEKK